MIDGLSINITWSQGMFLLVVIGGPTSQQLWRHHDDPKATEEWVFGVFGLEISRTRSCG